MNSYTYSKNQLPYHQLSKTFPSSKNSTFLNGRLAHWIINSFYEIINSLRSHCSLYLHYLAQSLPSMPKWLQHEHGKSFTVNGLGFFSVFYVEGLREHFWPPLVLLPGEEEGCLWLAWAPWSAFMPWLRGECNSGGMYEEVHCGPAPEPAVSVRSLTADLRLADSLCVSLSLSLLVPDSGPEERHYLLLPC